MIYKFDYKFHLLFKKVNPVVLIHKLVTSKEKHRKYIKTLDGAMKEPQFGVSSMFAGGFLYGLYFLLVFGLVNFTSVLLEQNFKLSKYHFILMVIPSTILLYFMVFKGDLYLKYFKEFEKYPKSKLNRLSVLYFLNVILIILFVFLSFVFLIKRNY